MKPYREIEFTTTRSRNGLTVGHGMHPARPSDANNDIIYWVCS